jgi:hypothetical protein
MVLRITGGLQSIGRPNDKDIALFYGRLVFPHFRVDALSSSSSDDTSSDTSDATWVGSVPAVCPTALLMHLISTLREKCIVTRRQCEETSTVEYARPPTDALVDRIRHWLEASDFGCEDLSSCSGTLEIEEGDFKCVQ